MQAQCHRRPTNPSLPLYRCHARAKPSEAEEEEGAPLRNVKKKRPVDREEDRLIIMMMEESEPLPVRRINRRSGSGRTTVSSKSGKTTSKHWPHNTGQMNQLNTPPPTHPQTVKSPRNCGNQCLSMLTSAKLLIVINLLLASHASFSGSQAFAAGKLSVAIAHNNGNNGTVCDGCDRE